MNFLAHLFLSPDDEEVLIGNFMADFVNNKQMKNLSEKIQEGILLHRRIDHYTDSHSSVLKGVRRLYPLHRKYAPAIIDVYYDCILANEWSKYTEESLESFTRRVYQILMDHHKLMPDGLQQSLPGMVQADWLSKYKEIYGLQRAFGSMRRRVSKPEWLEGVIDTFVDQRADLREEFNAFFPEVIEFVREG
jgi:acyl carrier protein phosphodiesterase